MAATDSQTCHAFCTKSRARFAIRCARRYFRLIVNVAILIKSATSGRSRKVHIVGLRSAFVRCRFWVLCLTCFLWQFRCNLARFWHCAKLSFLGARARCGLSSNFIIALAAITSRTCSRTACAGRAKARRSARR